MRSPSSNNSGGILSPTNLRLNVKCKEMQAAGHIVKSSSPWSSNVVMVRKHDGTLRFCIDFRKLNAVTKGDCYPLPKISACLDALSGAHYFSAFDLRSGYYQVAMDPKDADKTSFVTKSGTYRFERLPMGLKNAGATFQRMMDLIMQGLNFEICLIYLDDIIVYSRTITEHVERLEVLFQRLRSTHLKLKPSKCRILRERAWCS